MCRLRLPRQDAWNWHADLLLGGVREPESHDASVLQEPPFRRYATCAATQSKYFARRHLRGTMLRQVGSFELHVSGHVRAYTQVCRGVSSFAHWNERDPGRQSRSATNCRPSRRTAPRAVLPRHRTAAAPGVARRPQCLPPRRERCMGAVSDLQVSSSETRLNKPDTAFLTLHYVGQIRKRSSPRAARILRMQAAFARIGPTPVEDATPLPNPGRTWPKLGCHRPSSA